MGNILVFKNADFSANAIDTSELMDQLESCTIERISVGYSDLYYVDKQIQRDCVVAKEITNGSHNGAGEGEEEDVDQTSVEVIVEGTRGQFQMEKQHT